MMRRTMNIFAGMMTVAAMLLLASLASCTMVEFSGTPIDKFDDVEDVKKSHTAEVCFAVEWPKTMSNEDVPLYVTVVMNRIQSSAAHYVYHLDSAGNLLETVDIPEDYPEEEIPSEDGDVPSDEDVPSEDETPEDDTPGENVEPQAEDVPDGETPDEGESEEPEEEPEEEYNPSAVLKGFYSIAAVAVSDFEDYIVPDVVDFKDSLDASMRDVYVTIPQLTREEKAEHQYIDYNSMYPYIRHVSPFYYVRPSQKTHTEVWSDTDDEVLVKLKPQPLTRKISVGVTLDVEEGVTIDRLVGVISGVPSQVQLMTGYVSEERTSKMPFEMTSTDGKYYEGHVNAFGLFSPQADSLIVGPGILTVILHASVEENGVLHKRVRHSSVSLKKEIDAAEIMTLTEDRSAYRFSDTVNTDGEGNQLEVKEYNIKVQGYKMVVTREKIIAGPDQGFEVWKPIGDNEDPEVNPGLHPEV